MKRCAIMPLFSILFAELMSTPRRSILVWSPTVETIDENVDSIGFTIVTVCRVCDDVGSIGNDCSLESMIKNYDWETSNRIGSIESNKMEYELYFAVTPIIKSNNHQTLDLVALFVKIDFTIYWFVIRSWRNGGTALRWK